MSMLRSDTASPSPPEGEGRGGGAVLDVKAVRRDFPFLQTGVAYLDSANTSQRPRRVIEAMEAYYNEFNANIHRGAYSVVCRCTARIMSPPPMNGGIASSSSRRP